MPANIFQTGQQDAPVTLLFHHRENGLTNIETGDQMNIHDRLDLFVVKSLESGIAQKAGIVNKNVNTIENPDRRIDIAAPPRRA